jgi:hypothetical protein
VLPHILGMRSMRLESRVLLSSPFLKKSFNVVYGLHRALLARHSYFSFLRIIILRILAGYVQLRHIRQRVIVPKTKSFVYLGLAEEKTRITFLLKYLFAIARFIPQPRDCGVVSLLRRSLRYSGLAAFFFEFSDDDVEVPYPIPLTFFFREFALHELFDVKRAYPMRIVLTDLPDVRLLPSLLHVAPQVTFCLASPSRFVYVPAALLTEAADI